MSNTLGAAPPTPAAGIFSRATLLLIILCGVQFLDAWDISSMAPALPQIQSDLGMSAGSLQWVVTAYVLGYGGFLLLGGRLADLLDRKKLLLWALFIFAAASLIGGLTSSETVLLATRLLKGVSAAFTAPASLAILLGAYSDEEARHRALGIYLTVSSVGFTSGLILGGALSVGSWRLVLLVPAALASLLLLGVGATIPRTTARASTRLRDVDLLGALTVTGGVIALVYAVSRAPEEGWDDTTTVVALIAAVALLVVFLLIQRTRTSPLVPLGIFRRRDLARGNIAIFLIQGSYVGWQFISTLYLQNEHSWSPVEVGLVFAPGGLAVLLTAQFWAGRVIRLGPWIIGTAGAVLMVAGTAWTLTLGNVDSLWVFIVASAVMGLGYTMSYVAANISAVAGATEEEHGLASGLFIASFQIGSGVILGVVSSAFGTHALAELSDYRAGIIAAVVVSTLALLVYAHGLVSTRTARPAVPVN